MKTIELAAYLDDLLNIRNIKDESLNGLQVMNSGNVHTIAFAVDASLEAYKEAAAAGAEMLLVHHGQFWGRETAVTGSYYHRLKALIDADLALYAAHLPLDMHPDLGNNIQAAKKMKWPCPEPFGTYHDAIIGIRIRFERAVGIRSFIRSLESGLQCHVEPWLFGKKNIKHLIYVSGGGLSLLDQAIEADADVFVTGEPKHSYYWTAKEANINVLFAGHYATETLGIRAVAANVEKQLKLKTVMLDLPTGL